MIDSDISDIEFPDIEISNIVIRIAINLGKQGYVVLKQKLAEIENDKRKADKTQHKGKRQN